MPSCINSLCVPLLSCLRLKVEVVAHRDMQALGRLPSLLILVLESEEEKRISYTIGSYEFQKLKRLKTNIEITLGKGALPMLEFLEYSASVGRKDSLVPWNNRCPLLDYVICQLDCANRSQREVEAAQAALRKAGRTHPNSPRVGIERHNYDKEAGEFIDDLELILLGLEVYRTADKVGISRMITSLETLFRDAAEPRVGRYGEQELRGFVTKFRSLLHDDAGTAQEEEPDNNDAMDSDTNTDDDGDNGDDDDGHNDVTEQEEAGYDVGTSSRGHQEGATSQP